MVHATTLTCQIPHLSLLLVLSIAVLMNGYIGEVFIIVLIILIVVIFVVFSEPAVCSLHLHYAVRLQWLCFHFAFLYRNFPFIYLGFGILLYSLQIFQPNAFIYMTNNCIFKKLLCSFFGFIIETS